MACDLASDAVTQERVSKPAPITVMKVFIFILLLSLGEANESHLLFMGLIARSVFRNSVPDDLERFGKLSLMRRNPHTCVV